MGADQTIAIRLSFKDGQAVSAQLQSLAMDGDRALTRLASSVQKPNAALKGLSAAVSETKSAAIGLTTGLGSVGNVLSAMGPGGFAAAAGIGAVSLALGKGLTEFAQAEQASLRFQAVLRTTGNSSGVTARDVEDMADAMEASTMATAEGVKESAAALTTFRSVSGANFKETIKLSQDLAATFGGDARSAAVQLGKALEDPEHGLTQLRRSGISFTDAQKEMIVEMYRAGDAAKAQALILEEVRKQVGGAGEGEAGGLTGAVHKLSAAWGNLFENIIATTGTGSTVTQWTEKLAAQMADLAEKSKNFGGSYAASWNEWRNLLAGGKSFSGAMPTNDPAKDLRDKQAAEQGAIDAQLWKAREDIAQRQKALDKDLVTSFQDAASKKRAIAEQLEKDLATANAKRDKIGYTDADVDAEISALQRIAANKVEAIEKPIRESQQRIRDQVAKTIAELDAQANKAANPRQSAIDQAVAKLPKEATPDDRAVVAERAARIYEQAAAQKELNEDLDREITIREKGKAAIQQSLPAQDAYNARIRELDEYLDAGAIGYEDYAREAEKAYDRALDASNKWEDGVTRGLRKYAEEAGNAARQSEQMLTSGLRAGEDAFIKWSQTGKVSASDLFNTIAEEGLRAMYRLSAAKLVGGDSSGGGIFGSILGGASSWFSNLIGGGSPAGYDAMTDFAYSTSSDFMSSIGLHKGGIPSRDEASFTRLVPASAFDNAPRYHSGIRPGEKAAILREDEGVFTPRQMDNADRILAAALSNQGSRVSVVVYNNAARVATATATSNAGPDGSVMIELLVDEVDQNMARRVTTGGSLTGEAIANKYGLNQSAGAYRS